MAVTVQTMAVLEERELLAVAVLEVEKHATVEN